MNCLRKRRAVGFELFRGAAERSSARNSGTSAPGSSLYVAADDTRTALVFPRGSVIRLLFADVQPEGCTIVSQHPEPGRTVAFDEPAELAHWGLHDCT
jgi:hypothetical protein